MRGWSQLLCLLLTGCGAQVVDRTSERDDGPVAVELEVLGEGRFVDGLLYVQARVDQRPPSMVIAEVTEDAITIVAERADLNGRTNWAHLGDRRHARLRGNDAIEVLDTSDPRAPALSITVDSLVVPAPFAGIIGGRDGRAMYCGRSHGGAPTLVTHNLRDMSAPILSPSFGECDPASFDGVAGWGWAWPHWDAGEEGMGSRAVIYTIGSQGFDGYFDVGWPEDGVAMYGRIVGAATDGSRVAFDNDSAWFMAFDPSGNAAPHVRTEFSLPKRLLAVQNQTAIFATSDGLRAYDLSNVVAPKVMVDHAVMDLDVDTVTFVAANDAFVVIADGEGRAIVAPRGVEQTVSVTPVSVRRDASVGGAG